MLRVRLKLQGPQHKDVADCCYNIARVHVVEGRPSKAARLFLQASGKMPPSDSLAPRTHADDCSAASSLISWLLHLHVDCPRLPHARCTGFSLLPTSSWAGQRRDGRLTRAGLRVARQGITRVTLWRALRAPRSPRAPAASSCQLPYMRASLNSSSTSEPARDDFGVTRQERRQERARKPPRTRSLPKCRQHPAPGRQRVSRRARALKPNNSYLSMHTVSSVYNRYNHRVAQGQAFSTALEPFLSHAAATVRFSPLPAPASVLVSYIFDELLGLHWAGKGGGT